MKSVDSETFRSETAFVCFNKVDANLFVVIETDAFVSKILRQFTYAAGLVLGFVGKRNIALEKRCNKVH